MKEKLSEACFVMNAIGGQALNDLRSWYCQFVLDPYKELFELGKPDGTFDKTKRRFAWFKRTSKEAAERYQDLFPPDWQINELIAYEFCRMTKLHLD